MRIYIISRATFETFYILLFRLVDWPCYNEQLHPSRLLLGVGSGHTYQATTMRYQLFVTAQSPWQFGETLSLLLGYKQRFFQPLQDPLGAQRPSLSSPQRHKGVFLGRAIVSRSRSSKEEPRIFVSPFLQRNKYMEFFSLPVDLSPI